MPNFMYPRTIQVTRTVIEKTTADGLHESEIKVLSNADASIQMKRARPVGPSGFVGPTQAADSIPEWLILIPVRFASRGIVHKADKVTDDLGITYIVEADYWNSLGYGLTCRLYHP